MARKSTAWFWAQRKAWFAIVDGTRHFLGEHPAELPLPKKSKRTGAWNAPPEIDTAFHKLLRGDQPINRDDPVVTFLDEFLVWCQENRAPRTADRYRDFLQDFVNVYGRVKVSALTTSHVTDWLGKRPKWNATTKRNAITALTRAFNWAVKNLSLDKNPIKGMEKPEPKRRTEIITPVESEKVLALTKGAFRELFIVTYDSGCRPSEITRLEARHLQLDKGRAVIPGKEAKGGIPRTVYFPTDRSMEIVRRLAHSRPEGPLFLNSKGNPWTRFAIKCAFTRLDNTFGRRIAHYSLRHSFITRKLVAGVDSHVVAALAGHKNTAMIDRVYSHVADDAAFMLVQASRDIPKQN